jgi:hypothetical protein
MSIRRIVFDLTGGIVAALLLFSLGIVTARHEAEQGLADRDRRIAALQSEMDDVARAVHRGRPARAAEGGGVLATAGVSPAASESRAAMVAEIKEQLQSEMGLVPVRLLRDRRRSFAELYAYDNQGHSNYGTAGYLGDGYFVTVKHAVVALQNDDQDGRRIVSIKLVYGRTTVSASLVDTGPALTEVDEGDWAILKVHGPADLPPLKVNLAFPYEFAEPIFRLGNDYSKGIILGTGYIGQRTPNGLITCLTDGHPGVSGGGVLDQHGDMVGIPIGRMQGDYRFSFILPLRREMFRKVPVAQFVQASALPAADRPE